MKTFHRACEVISQVAIVNFLLFGIIAFIIGGDAVNGKVESGHYYLASHGQLTEVNFLVFWYSKIHVYSIFVTWPLAMLASLLYGITGGGRTRPKSQAVATRKSTSNIFSNGIHNLKLLCWNVADFLEEVFWIILDSWRKPDFELFVRLSKQECIKELQMASDAGLSAYSLKKPILGYFSGNHFYLQKWRYNPWVRDGGVRPILSGKFSATPQGTYIRIWHRFTTIGIFFLATWFGTAFSLLFSFLLSPLLSAHYSQTDFYPFILIPLFYSGTFLVSIWIGSLVGNKNNVDVIKFVENVLNFSQPSK